MKRKLTEEQKRKMLLYHQERYDSLKIHVPKGRREYYKKCAAQAGLSLNQFVISSMDKIIQEMDIPKED